MMWNMFKQVAKDVKELSKINGVNANISIARHCGKISAYLDEKKGNVQNKIADKVVEVVTTTEEAYKSAFRNGYSGHQIKKQEPADINWAGINAMNKNRK